MTHREPVPDRVIVEDALSRGWRTFVQGLLVDLVVSVVTVLLVNIGTIEWTRNYWLGLAGLVGKSTIMAILSYLARMLLPPPGAVQVAREDSAGP